MCLPNDPDHLQYQSGVQGHTYIGGVENYYAGFPSLSSLTYHNVLCAVCYVATRSGVVMIPAKLAVPLTGHWNTLDISWQRFTLMLVAQLMNVLIKILSQFLDLILLVTQEHNLHLWSHTAMASPVLHMMMRKNSLVLFALVRPKTTKTDTDCMCNCSFIIIIFHLCHLVVQNIFLVTMFASGKAYESAKHYACMKGRETEILNMRVRNMNLQSFPCSGHWKI